MKGLLLLLVVFLVPQGFASLFPTFRDSKNRTWVNVQATKIYRDGRFVLDGFLHLPGCIGPPYEVGIRVYPHPERCDLYYKISADLQYHRMDECPSGQYFKMNVYNGSCVEGPVPPNCYRNIRGCPMAVMEGAPRNSKGGPRSSLKYYKDHKSYFHANRTEGSVKTTKNPSDSLDKVVVNRPVYVDPEEEFGPIFRPFVPSDQNSMDDLAGPLRKEMEESSDPEEIVPTHRPLVSGDLDQSSDSRRISVTLPPDHEAFRPTVKPTVSDYHIDYHIPLDDLAKPLQKEIEESSDPEAKKHKTDEFPSFSDLEDFKQEHGHTEKIPVFSNIPIIESPSSLENDGDSGVDEPSDPEEIVPTHRPLVSDDLDSSLDNVADPVHKEIKKPSDPEVVRPTRRPYAGMKKPSDPEVVRPTRRPYAGMKKPSEPEVIVPTHRPLVSDDLDSSLDNVGDPVHEEMDEPSGPKVTVPPVTRPPSRTRYQYLEPEIPFFHGRRAKRSVVAPTHRPLVSDDADSIVDDSSTVGKSSYSPRSGRAPPSISLNKAKRSPSGSDDRKRYNYENYEVKLDIYGRKWVSVETDRGYKRGNPWSFTRYTNGNFSLKHITNVYDGNTCAPFYIKAFGRVAHPELCTHYYQIKVPQLEGYELKKCPDGEVFHTASFRERSCVKVPQLPFDCFRNIRGCPEARKLGVPQPSEKRSNKEVQSGRLLQPDSLFRNLVTNPDETKQKIANSYKGKGRHGYSHPRSPNLHPCNSDHMQGLLTCLDDYSFVLGHQYLVVPPSQRRGE